MIKNHAFFVAPSVPASRGFTLVETLVAITVLIVAIVGPLYAVHKSIAASYAARDQLIATALAQEGLEYIRSIRDGNYLEGSGDWMDGLTACFGTTGCTVAPSQEPAACASAGGGGCPALRQDLSAPAGTPKLYVQTTNGTYTPSRFIRKVTISNVTATEVVVTTTVSWTTLRIPYSVTVSEHLYNWL
jgi:prepilin-type N-terminal cleavage/methylation domain-containing protein